jgi:DNA-binding winged helix-turn-helix (wHTH) protein
MAPDIEQNLRQLYEFGRFRLDPGERLLLGDGEVLPLTPKAFDLLLALVEQAGHLMEKEVLLKAVWPDSFVEENNLADNISRLRKTLGEGENGQKFIETIPKRGYRFVAEVRQQRTGATATTVEETLPPEANPETILRARAVNSAPARSKRLTILRVVAFSVPLMIGLGIWLYVRIERDFEIKQLEFKGNFYATNDGQLGGKWTEGEIRKGIDYYNRALALDPNNASAYQGLALAWNFLSDVYVSPREAMPRAKAAAVNALQRNETSGPAHVSLGLVKMQYDWDWAGAEQEFKRAMELRAQPNVGPQLYAWYLMAIGRNDEARVSMLRAVEADPVDDFSIWTLGLSFYFARQHDQAVEQYRRAIGVEPQSYWSHMLLGWAYEQQGNFGQAIAELNQANRLTDNPQVVASLAHTFALSGQKTEAQRILAELQTDTRRYVSPYDIATVYAGLGDKEEALTWLEKAYEDRSGWLAWWIKVDPKFDILHPDPRFRDLLRRVGHTV